MSRKTQKLPAAMPTGSFLLTVGVRLETEATTYNSRQLLRRLSPYRTLSGNEKHEVQKPLNAQRPSENMFSDGL